MIFFSETKAKCDFDCDRSIRYVLKILRLLRYVLKVLTLGSLCLPCYLQAEKNKIFTRFLSFSYTFLEYTSNIALLVVEVS